jgi:hypothetical protein
MLTHVIENEDSDFGTWTSLWQACLPCILAQVRSIFRNFVWISIRSTLRKRSLIGNPHITLSLTYLRLLQRTEYVCSWFFPSMLVLVAVCMFCVTKLLPQEHRPLLGCKPPMSVCATEVVGHILRLRICCTFITLWTGKYKGLESYGVISHWLCLVIKLYCTV